MSILDWFRGAERRSEPAKPVSSWDLLAGRNGFDTGAGVPVSPYLAENLAAVFGAVQIISESVATLPFLVYERVDDGVRQVAPHHPVARLLNRAPNELQTPPEFIETMVAHCLLRGNSFAEVRRDGRGAPVELTPLHPDTVSVLRLPNSRRVVYDVTDEDGGTRRLLPEEVLHLKDRSDDGIVGKSRLQRARETLGTALAAEDFAASTYRNGARVSGILVHPDQIGEDASKNLGDSFKAQHAGTKNAGSIPVLEEGVRFQQISVSPADAEMLASRKFGVEQIGRLFRIPMPILGSLEGGNYSSLVELNRWFAGQTIRPWLFKLEHAFARTLFSEEGRRRFEIEADMDDLLRGDFLQRMQGFRIAREIGLYNANEIRRFEHQNPRTDADAETYFSPLNMNPEQAGKPREE